jgi:hypothetical protein
LVTVLNWLSQYSGDPVRGWQEGYAKPRLSLAGGTLSGIVHKSGDMPY